jgi:anaerobilin synthase
MDTAYTSFSVAGINALPRFGEQFQSIFKEEVKPKSETIALYVHIPYCKTICQFCMLRKGAKATDEIPGLFIKSLINEFGLYRELLQNCKISTIYFGGGTPSMLSAFQFEEVLLALDKIFVFADDIEITFEGEATSLQKTDLLIALKRNHVRRISFGLQTFDENIRRLLGRTDCIGDLFKLRQQLDSLGFEEVNVDYIYNLPGTDVGFIEKDLLALKSFSPDSFDCHPLKYVSCSGFMLKEIVQNRMSVPNAEMRIAMFNTIREWAINNQFSEQFADQYSRIPGDNSNVYMKHLYGLNGGEYIGFGPGARSHYGDFGFSNNQNIDQYSTQIHGRVKPIAKSVHAPLSDNYITCFPKRNSRIYLDDIERSTDPAYFIEKLNCLSDRGYIEITNNGYSLTYLGLSWYQNIQEELLSKKQLLNHRATIKERANKLNNFDGYFDDLGMTLQ